MHGTLGSLGEAFPDPEARARLVATLDHEFRTPLAALLGNVELVHEHRDRIEALDPQLAKSLDAIERAGWRLRDLCAELVELVRDDGR